MFWSGRTRRNTGVSQHQTPAMVLTFVLAACVTSGDARRTQTTAPQAAPRATRTEPDEPAPSSDVGVPEALRESVAAALPDVLFTDYEGTETEGVATLRWRSIRIRLPYGGHTGGIPEALEGAAFLQELADANAALSQTSQL